VNREDPELMDIREHKYPERSERDVEPHGKRAWRIEGGDIHIYICICIYIERESEEQL